MPDAPANEGSRGEQCNHELEKYVGSWVCQECGARDPEQWRRRCNRCGGPCKCSKCGVVSDDRPVVRPPLSGTFREQAAEIIERERTDDENSPGLEDLIASALSSAHATGREEARGLMEECRARIRHDHGCPVWNGDRTEMLCGCGANTILARIDAHLAGGKPHAA